MSWVSSRMVSLLVMHQTCPTRTSHLNRHFNKNWELWTSDRKQTRHRQVCKTIPSGKDYSAQSIERGEKTHGSERTRGNENCRTAQDSDKGMPHGGILSDKSDHLTRTPSPDSVSPRKPVPPDPESCCESGCVNCVWIKYANEVNEFYPPEEREAKLKEILDNVDDYNVKMFLKMELDL